jgi:polysaccharide pyruvyl transferase WcaK-like protein
MDFFSFIIGVCFGVAAIHMYYAHKGKQLIRKLVEMHEEQKEKQRTVTVECIENKLFAYDKNTSEFLCSFKTLTDLETQLKISFPDVDWLIDGASVRLVKEHANNEQK